jgi:hypothetical protein
MNGLFRVGRAQTEFVWKLVDCMEDALTGGTAIMGGVVHKQQCYPFSVC